MCKFIQDLAKSIYGKRLYDLFIASKMENKIEISTCCAEGLKMQIPFK